MIHFVAPRPCSTEECSVFLFIISTIEQLIKVLRMVCIETVERCKNWLAICSATIVPWWREFFVVSWITIEWNQKNCSENVSQWIAFKIYETSFRHTNWALFRDDNPSDFNFLPTFLIGETFFFLHHFYLNCPFCCLLTFSIFLTVNFHLELNCAQYVCLWVFEHLKRIGSLYEQRTCHRGKNNW